MSVALFVRTDPGATARLDSFFGSSRFHRGMQAGESLAQTFADWFLDRPVPRDLLKLEAALARVRRAREAGVRPSLDAPLCLAGAVEVLVWSTMSQTAAAYSSHFSRLR